MGAGNARRNGEDGERRVGLVGFGVGFGGFGAQISEISAIEAMFRGRVSTRKGRAGVNTTDARDQMHVRGVAGGSCAVFSRTSCPKIRARALGILNCSAAGQGFGNPEAKGSQIRI